MDQPKSRSRVYFISKLSIVILFLALIRSIAEPMRLQHYSPETLAYEQIMPYLLAALIAASALLLMMLLYFIGKHKFVIALAVLSIAALVVIKLIYLL